MKLTQAPLQGGVPPVARLADIVVSVILSRLGDALIRAVGVAAAGPGRADGRRLLGALVNVCSRAGKADRERQRSNKKVARL